MFDQEITEMATGFIAALRTDHLWVTTAESCTGGLIAGALTSVSGASDVLGAGFVTYSNTAKEKLIGVLPATLERYGAVSAEVADEMARGALRVSGADVAISVTGIAGPGGGSADKPVGLVFIAVAKRTDKCVCKRFDFGDAGRDEVRRLTILSALKLAHAQI